VVTTAIAFLLLNWQGLLVMAALLVMISAVCFYFRSLFGGLTGDNYGAINEIAESLVLIMLIILV
jgi:cobalamin synthase